MTAPIPIGSRRHAATHRIIEAARELVAQGGAAGISVGDAATRAGVSKALVLYHFRDKESLLAALVEHVGAAVVERERRALASAGAQALDDYWAWLHGELAHGDVRILLSLAGSDSQKVRAAARRVASERRAMAAGHVGLVFERLGLAPRLPPALLAETVLAFLDGACVAAALEPERDMRPAFDALWLALLTFAE